jgi:hypothetical protein
MTDNELPSLLSTLKANAQRLNVESNSINSTIASVENDLIQANAGLSVFLETARDSAGNYYYAEQLAVQGEEEGVLGFTKLDSGWHLVVRYESADGEPPDEQHLVQLAQASRETRIAALKQLPRLIERINRWIESAVETIIEAKKLAS